MVMSGCMNGRGISCYSGRYWKKGGCNRYWRIEVIVKSGGLDKIGQVKEGVREGSEYGDTLIHPAFQELTRITYDDHYFRDDHVVNREHLATIYHELER